MTDHLGRYRGSIVYAELWAWVNMLGPATVAPRFRWGGNRMDGLMEWVVDDFMAGSAP